MAVTIDANGEYVNVPYSSHAATRTYAIWFKGAEPTGGGLGRFFDKRVSGSEVEMANYNDTGNTIWFTRSFDSSGWGDWYISKAMPATWTHLVITYDSGSDANDPVFYIDGASQGVTENTTPSGNAVDNADNYILGNRASDGLRYLNGELAEFAIWDRILNADEISGLADGFSPSFFSQSLVSYVPLVRNRIDYLNGACSDGGSPTVAVHPPIIYPATPHIIIAPTAVAAPDILKQTTYYYNTLKAAEVAIQ